VRRCDDDVIHPIAVASPAPLTQRPKLSDAASPSSTKPPARSRSGAQARPRWSMITKACGADIGSVIEVLEGRLSAAVTSPL